MSDGRVRLLDKEGPEHWGRTLPPPTSSMPRAVSSCSSLRMLPLPERPAPIAACSGLLPLSRTISELGLTCFRVPRLKLKNASLSPHLWMSSSVS